LIVALSCVEGSPATSRAGAKNKVKNVKVVANLLKTLMTSPDAPKLFQMLTFLFDAYNRDKDAAVK
jgi:hypothetical protein